jgi:transcriptional regulator
MRDWRRRKMYVPPAFRHDDLASLHATMRAARLCSFVTATAQGLIATPLPALIEETEGNHGVLYGHVARANPQWRTPPVGEAMAIFMGPDAYITPSWYVTKQATAKVVCRPGTMWPCTPTGRSSSSRPYRTVTLSPTG